MGGRMGGWNRKQIKRTHRRRAPEEAGLVALVSEDGLGEGTC